MSNFIDMRKELRYFEWQKDRQIAVEDWQNENFDLWWWAKVATFFTFTDSLSAGNIGEFDVAFLDIDMEKLNGIELARKLRSKNPTTIIIFVTNFIQYAPEGYEVNAFRYLLKSDIPYKLIPYFVDSLQEVLNSRQTVTFSISGELIDVQTKNILYLESDKHIIVMHLINDARTEYRF